jgi:hypothetical protein
MRLTLAITLLFSSVACGTSHLGTCTKDADCPAYATCDPSRSVCVIKRGVCFPACDASHVCDPATQACQPVTSPSVSITSPAAGGYATVTLQATAVALAPGGVTGLTFNLSSNATVVASASGAVSPSDPSSWSATIPLTSVADGAVDLTATLTYAGGSATSAKVSLTVDQTPPAISMQTDGRTTLYAGGQTDTVVASITDALSGVKDSTVSLVVNGRSIPGVAGAGGTYSFPVVIDDTVLAAGTSATVAFTITAGDNAGNTPFTLSGDPKQVIRADRDAPAITGITYTPAGIIDASGHRVLGGPAGGSVTVNATITDGAGVAPASACLRMAGETGACAHPGTAGAGNGWTFALPRPAAPQNGTTPFNFTLEADDTLAASLSGASQAEHQARFAQVVYFNYGLLSISIFPDTKPYARTAIPVPVSALITSDAGVPNGAAFLNGTVAPSFRDGGFFTFPLDARGADAGVEGPYAFQVSATDNSSNTANAGGTRIIDDAPPDASVRVFKGTDPGGASVVTYPTAVPGTGWDGTQFVYSDTVHVKGTIADVSGIPDAGLHIDYVQIDGGVSAGTVQWLPCTAGQTLCTFDVQVALNAPTNGTFNTFTRGKPMGDLVSVPVDNLKVVIDANDAAKSANGTAASHSGTSSRDAQTTRLLWQMYLPAAVSGLGIHPNGDLIVTLDGGADTVVALRPDDGGVHWSFGADAGTNGLGPVLGTPAIGSGTPTTARVYVAARDGGVYAIGPTGAEAWHFNTPDVLDVGPAVLAASTPNPVTDQVIMPGALGTSKIYSIASGLLVSSAAVGDADTLSAPLILGGSVFYATVSTVAMHTISALGALGTASKYDGTNTAYFEVITDGFSLYVWRNTADRFLSLDTSLLVANQNWTQNVTPTGAGAVALDGSILVSLTGGPVNTFDPGTGANSTLFNLGGSGGAPLIGWDGQLAHQHFYLPRNSAVTYAYDSNGTLLWFADPNGATYRAFAMDCSGRLFGATNAPGTPVLAGGKSLVYALITDDRGLADTPWPSYRLDARNTGNVGSPKYGILPTGGACSQ